MKIFITGATGVIGRRALVLLVRAGHDVTAAGHSPHKVAALKIPGVKPIGVDLFDKQTLGRCVAGQEVVINLATHIPASSLAALFPRAWKENDRLRRIASVNVAEAPMAGGAQRLIQESFAPVYPDCGDEWIDETTPLAPARYNRTVVDAERAAERCSAGGRVGAVLRFASFYGPDAIQVIDLIRFIRRGWVPLPGRAEAFLSSVSHDDAATAVVAALARGTRRFQHGRRRADAAREFFNSLAEVLRAPPPRIPPPWMAHLFGSLGRLLARSQRISNKKLRAEIKWAPTYPSARAGWPATVEALSRYQRAEHPVLDQRT
jgi:2-alkyl-3-oxoalkanoate reductase